MFWPHELRQTLEIYIHPPTDDILRLHDYVYVRFEDGYKAAMGGGRLGKRRGVESRPGNPIVLPLTGGFDHELTNFTGSKQAAGKWQTVAFKRLVEAVETTAIQRRAERWRPGLILISGREEHFTAVMV